MRGGGEMADVKKCPFYKEKTNECTVTPWDHNAPRTESDRINRCCTERGWKTCGNYEAWERGEYKVCR